MKSQNVRIKKNCLTFLSAPLHITHLAYFVNCKWSPWVVKIILPKIIIHTWSTQQQISCCNTTQYSCVYFILFFTEKEGLSYQITRTYLGRQNVRRSSCITPSVAKRYSCTQVYVPCRITCTNANLLSLKYFRRKM